MSLTATTQPQTLRERIRANPRELLTLIAITLVVAVVWWLLALHEREGSRFLVWDDQASTFMSALSYLRTPYDSPGFFNPPWAMLLLAGIVYKFGGRSLFCTLHSPQQRPHHLHPAHLPLAAYHIFSKRCVLAYCH